MSLHISFFVSLSHPHKHTHSLTPYLSISLSLPPCLHLYLLSLHLPYISLSPFVSLYQPQNIHSLSPIYLSIKISSSPSLSLSSPFLLVPRFYISSLPPLSPPALCLVGTEQRPVPRYAAPFTPPLTYPSGAAVAYPVACYRFRRLCFLLPARVSSLSHYMVYSPEIHHGAMMFLF